MTKRNGILDQIKNNVVLADGAMGTYAMEKGLVDGDCTEELNLARPGDIAEIHSEYIRAGAQTILTNSFGANRVKLEQFGLGDKAGELSEAAARIAREAAGDDVLVAGSVGPIGALLRPYGKLTLAELRDIFKEQIYGLLKGGVDYLQFETSSGIVELLEGLSVARESSDLPVFCSMTFTADGNTALGDDIEVAMRRLLDSGADAVGINCNLGPKESYDLVRDRILAGNLPTDDFILTVVPNAGYPRMVEGKPVYPASPVYFAEFAIELIELGVNMLGGCCGTTPQHVKALSRVLRDPEPRPKRIAEKPVEPVTVTPEAKPRPEPVSTGFDEKLGDEFVVTVEVDPPRGLSYQKVAEKVRALKDAGINAVNIADNPMARVRMSSFALAFILRNEVGIDTILHLTCRDRNLLGLQSDLIGAAALGVNAVLALTGDPSKVGDFPQATSVFDVNSTGLVKMIAELNGGKDLAGNKLNAPTRFKVGVALNIASSNMEKEQGRFAEKLDAGANFAMTQPFYDPDIWLRYLDRYGEPPIPIILGVLPLRTYRHAKFLHNEVPGITVPERIRSEMKAASYRSKEEETSTGVRIAREIMARVKDSAQGVYITPPFGKYEVVPRILEG
ncbi:MAG: bifunctional homocysteine S-methyltransferase/methylenetetrahydrofolate reductase [bacterium]|nr:bifunctional homocysteine S-methyltransferase/methylenetetrahydrofolate reductase [bacterium]